MITQGEVVELLGVVLQRLPIIECVQDEPKDKRTLVEELDCSRSTVNRAVRELEALNVLTYSDGKYHITSIGELVVIGYTDLIETLEARIQLDPLLQWIPEDEFDLELSLLTDADIITAESGDPYAMINRHVEGLKSMEECWFLIPYTGMHAAETTYERIVNHGAQAGLIVQPSVAEVFQSNPQYTRVIQEMLATDGLRIFKYNEELPFAVGVLDDTVQILGDDDGEPRTLVETDNPAVRAWAKTMIEEYKDRSEPLELNTFAQGSDGRVRSQ